MMTTINYHAWFHKSRYTLQTLEDTVQDNNSYSIVKTHIFYISHAKCKGKENRKMKQQMVK